MPDFIANRYGHYKHGDLDTYSALARLAAKEDRPLYPHIETIAKIARRSIRTVKRAIKKFQADLVLIVNKTGRASNYILVPLLPTGFPDPDSGEYIVAKAMAGCRQIPKNGDYLYAGNANYDVPKVPVRDDDMSPQECQSVTPEVPKSHHAYNIEETHLRNTATTPPPPKSPPEPPPPPPPASPVVALPLDDFEMLRALITKAELKDTFARKTFKDFLQKGLTIGQIKTLIYKVNSSDTIEGWGYFMSFVDKNKVTDADKEAAEKEKKEAENAEIISLKERQKENGLKIREAKDKEKFEKFLQEYIDLPENIKKIIFEKVVERIKVDIFKDEVINLGFIDCINHHSFKNILRLNNHIKTLVKQGPEVLNPKPTTLPTPEELGMTWISNQT